MSKVEHAHCHSPALAYTYEDAGYMLGKLSRALVCNLVTAGKLIPISIGDRKAIPHSELERYIREQLDTT